MTDHDLTTRPDAYVADPVAVDPASTAARSAEWFVLRAYDANQRELYGFARSIVRDTDAAEDLVAEAFVRLVAEVAAGRPPERVRPWLFRVVANVAINQSRRRAVAARLLATLRSRESTDLAEPADARLLRDESTAAVREALLRLPMDARTALLLAAHDVPGREIAAAIGRSEAATRTLLFRARVALREKLTERGGAS